MTDKWIGPRVLCGDSNPPPDGYEYVRRYADDVRLAAGSGTTVENENVAGYVAFPPRTGCAATDCAPRGAASST